MKKKWLRILLLLFIFSNTSFVKIFAQHHKAPFEPVIVQSSNLTLSLNSGNGLPYSYRYKGSVVQGEDSGHKINIIICQLMPRSYLTVMVIPKKIKVIQGHADVFYEAAFDGKPAVSFHIKYDLDNSAVIITMQNIIEQKGYELIEAALPNLATVREEDGPCWLAHGKDGGELVELKNAIPAKLPFDDNFGNIGYVLPVAIIGTKKTTCAIEVSAFMDGLTIEIVGEKKYRHAHIGTIQVYRVHGGRSYNMNDGGDGMGGNENTPNLLVGQESRCRLDFTKNEKDNGEPNWLDAANTIADRMPPSPTKYFDDKFIYLIAGKNKTQKEPRTTFAQSEKLIKDIAALTDYAPQIPLISGWVYDGQDTGYPSEDSVNQSLGGYDALMQLMAEGKKYNANVSVNVNYDDAYKSSPQFDTAFIARRPDGKIWKSRDWDGEYSYITGMAKYMKKWGEQRMDYTVQHYKIHDAMLIDAMSWFAIRNDWDIENPASGYKNLVEGKYKIVDGFRKRGVHVISEQLRYPFIGKLAVTADGAGGGSDLFDGEPIPLLAAIYRKSAIWGTGNFSRSDAQRSLFWNCRSIQWYDNASDRTAIIDYYFMTVLPFSKVHDKKMESYERNGFKTIIGLEGNSKIWNDWMTEDYAIVYKGVEIAGHGASFCPIDDNRIAFFSREAKELSATLPAGWDKNTIVARALFIDHKEVVPVKTEDGKIIVSAEANRPVIVYRNIFLADKKW